MRKVLMFVFAMCLSLFAVGAMAQTATTGSIEGTVTRPERRCSAGGHGDRNRCEPDLATQTATTDDKGRYVIPQLATGKIHGQVDADSRLR